MRIIIQKIGQNVVTHILLGCLAGIYLTNQAQVLMGYLMEGRNPPFALAVTLIILHFDFAAFLAAVALGWIAGKRMWWAAAAVGGLLFLYHGYWTNYYLQGEWQWWYAVRVLLILPFVMAGVWLGHWLTMHYSRIEKILYVAGYAVLLITSGLYALHLLTFPMG